jgi:site-specific recombinase XerD
MTQLPTPLFDTLEQLSLHTQFIHETLPFAQGDYRYANAFLHGYRSNEATFTAYRRELERLLQWTWLIAQKSLQNLTREDIETYIEFCMAPPKAWIGLKRVSRFIKKEGERLPNPDWRPFVATVSKTAYRRGEKPDKHAYSLSQKALQEIFTVCSSFFNYLLLENYVQQNPVALVRQKSRFIRKQQAQAPIRKLSELQWSYVIETAELMAKEQPEPHARTWFIMNALYGMYLRISELAASPRWEPRMGHFYQDSDGNWFFTTVGKGNKQRNISVSDAMLDALKHWRGYLKLSPALPLPGDTHPLLPKTRGNNQAITSTRRIRMIVQVCFDKAMERLRTDGFHDEAEQLMAATVHWLRHTSISEDVKRRPKEHVRDDAGHSSSAITDKYINVEARERHATHKKRTIKPDI